jgi:DNA-binding NarL/FixJ family response regulator
VDETPTPSRRALSDVAIVTHRRLLWEAVEHALAADGLAVAPYRDLATHPAFGSHDGDARLHLIDIDDDGDIYQGWAVAERVGRVARAAAFGTGSPDRHRSRALALGLRGFISRGLSGPDFVHSVREAMVGRVRTRHAPLPRSADVRLSTIAVAELTARDREILHLLARGATSRQIARSLGLSHQTVRTYIQQVLRKLNAHSRMEACLTASALGVLSFGSTASRRDVPRPRIGSGATAGSGAAAVPAPTAISLAEEHGPR